MHNHYSYKILEQSRQNILTLEDVKNYTRISTDNDDNLLESMMNSAIQIAENFIKTSLVRKSVEVELDNSINIRLPFTPVIEITRIIADEIEVNPGDVKLDGEILTLPKYVECKRLKITYVAGYDDATLVPAPIIQGIMLHISSMYDTRGTGAVPLDNVFALYQTYRKMVL